MGITVDKSKCTKCGICVRTCDMDIKKVGDRECIHCGKCIPGCPVKAIHFKGPMAYIYPGYSKETLAKKEVAPKTLSSEGGSDNAR